MADLSPAPLPSARAAATFGGLAVALNVIGVVGLRDIPAAYKPTMFAAWLEASLAHPTGATVSAVAFTAGVLALIPFAGGLARAASGPQAGIARIGAIFIAAAGLMNATATLAPFVAIGPLAAASNGPLANFQSAAFALLGWAITMDALFNALFGIGMILSGWAMARDPRRSRALAIMGVVVGAATVPVAMQPVSIVAANWLQIAGPLWLLWLSWTSVSLWRQSP
ncbi:MAG: hypothetical protein EXQ91_01065 [Alphaproteobacteria bacterium]|nr:hypothetical protein [Alphaproteobacteria bacterium]